MIACAAPMLARQHAHPRDARVAFDEAAHVYTVDGCAVIGSVSSLWELYFESFCPSAVATRCYSKWAHVARTGDGAWDIDDWTYLNAYARLVEEGGDSAAAALGIPADFTEKSEGRGYTRLLTHLWSKGFETVRCIAAVVTLWGKLGERASARGTFVHLQCELECNGMPFDPLPTEVLQYLSFRLHNPELTPYRTEWSVFARLGLYIVSGQVDAVFRDVEGHYHMIDYKCCARALVPANPFGKFGSRPFDKVPDTPWGHYACQQNIYRYILEKYYQLPLRSARLLRLHPTLLTYELVEVPDLRANVARLFDNLTKKTRAPNIKECLRQKFRRKCRTLLVVVRLSFYSSSSHHSQKMAACAMKLKGAADKLRFKMTVGTEKKSGLGITHRLAHVGLDGVAQVPCVQMPRATTFGVRDSKLNPGKYGLTLSYRSDQKVFVDELKAIHGKLKAAIIEQYSAVLPNSSFEIMEKLSNKNPEFPTELLTMEPPTAGKAADKYKAAMALFMEEITDKVNQVFTFGASETHMKAHKGRAKMVSFSSASTNSNGKSYPAAYMVNIACPQKFKVGGGVEFHPAEEGLRGRPNFNFTACESPESNLKDITEIENINILDKLSPADGEPFARDGVAVVSFPYMHIKQDESSISVCMSLEHFHCYQRDSGVLGKRSFVVMDDDDTPQADPLPLTTETELAPDDQDKEALEDDNDASDEEDNEENE
jgi:hypothetical protein